MAMTTATSLTDLAERLRQRLDTTNSFGPVTTRLLLRTGVSLRNPKPEQVNDGALVKRVSEALAEMGYRL